MKSNSVDCIILIDVFEHISKEDLNKLVCELNRVLKKDGRILIFTSEYGFGIGLIWKRLVNPINMLTKADVSEGHLNRLKFKELKELFEKNNLLIEDYYHYSALFQQSTDFLKDSFTKILSHIFRIKSESRKGQFIKESVKTKKSFLIDSGLLFFSLISYLDILLFGKITGNSIFLKIKKK